MKDVYESVKFQVQLRREHVEGKWTVTFEASTDDDGARALASSADTWKEIAATLKQRLPAELIAAIPAILAASNVGVEEYIQPARKGGRVRHRKVSPLEVMEDLRGVVSKSNGKGKPKKHGRRKPGPKPGFKRGPKLAAVSVAK
jgi:hypothetical protein